ncbi:MAG: hypothetical protein ABJA84_00125 [Polaromonas sp.]
MQITNNTTTYQIAELMGDQADERDGRIVMSLLSRDCVVDTDECDFLALVDEAAKIRRNEDECEADYTE